MIFTLNLKHSALKKIVLIGASTGGPGQIEKIIASVPLLNNTSIVIAQHMVMDFIPSFAKRLQHASLNPVQMANENTSLEVGNIYVCNGSTSIEQSNSKLFFTKADSLNTSYNPNINTIFESFAPFAKEISMLCSILTGIGDDGVNGCKELSLNGAKCITEDKKSAIVDGMPSRARVDVPNIEVQDISTIIQTIKEFCE